jgi:hypothetical protein
MKKSLRETLEENLADAITAFLLFYTLPPSEAKTKQLKELIHGYRSRVPISRRKGKGGDG